MIKDNSYGVIPIMKKDKEFLFLLVEHRKGHWSFPKGHPEKNETARETALRELAEETGITDCRIDDRASFSENYQFERNGEMHDKTNAYFLCFVDDPTVTIQEKEIAGYAWANYAVAQETITFPQAKKVLVDTHTFLTQHIQ